MDFIAEKNFLPIFQVDGHHFFDEINNRGWNYLIHDGNDFYIPHIVAEFYNGIQNINWEDEVISLEWREQEKFVDLQTISNMTQIPLRVGANATQSLEEYMSLMGSNCRRSNSGGIVGTTMYKNVYATCKWLVHNATSSTQTSTFFENTLHIVQSLMLHNYNFCMCKQLFSTIGLHFQRMNQIHAKLALPCLITDICSNWIPPAEYNEVQFRTNLVAEHRSRGYSLCEQKDWDIACLEENVLADEGEQAEEEDFWSYNPADIEDYIEHSTEVFRRLNLRLQNLEGGESSSGTRKRRRGRGRGI